MIKIFRIIRSKLWGKYTMSDDPKVIERRKICESCPLMSLNSSNGKWYWEVLNFNEPYCTSCKCEIAAKTSEYMESCPEEKWEQII